MTTILAPICPLWCAGDTIDPLGPDAIEHRSAGTTVALDGGNRSSLRVALARTDYRDPQPGEHDPTPLVTFKLARPTDDDGPRICAAVSVGSAARFATLLDVARGELRAETMFGGDGAEPGDFSFAVRGLAHESISPLLSVRRYGGRDVALAVVRLGDDLRADVGAVLGVSGLRDLSAAIETEVAGVLDGAVL